MNLANNNEEYNNVNFNKANVIIRNDIEYTEKEDFNSSSNIVYLNYYEKKCLKEKLRLNLSKLKQYNINNEEDCKKSNLKEMNQDDNPTGLDSKQISVCSDNDINSIINDLNTINKKNDSNIDISSEQSQSKKLILIFVFFILLVFAIFLLKYIE